MLIAFWVLRPLITRPITAVVHVGAHEAEEFETYRRHGIKQVAWIECQPQVARALKSRIGSPENLVIQGCAWSESGISKTLKITNNSVSSSLLELKEHKNKYPTVVETRRVAVKTRRLDELIPPGFSFNFLNLDIQGAELEAIRGLGKLINQIDYIYSEVNQSEMYSGLALVGQVDDYLGEAGFNRMATFWTNDGWGDAVYCREGSISEVRKYYARALVGVAQGALRGRLAMRRLRKMVDGVYLRLLRNNKNDSY